jgi:hypothetical protein
MPCSQMIKMNISPPPRGRCRRTRRPSLKDEPSRQPRLVRLPRPGQPSQAPPPRHGKGSLRSAAGRPLPHRPNPGQTTALPDREDETPQVVPSHWRNHNQVDHAPGSNHHRLQPRQSLATGERPVPCSCWTTAGLLNRWNSHCAAPHAGVAAADSRGDLAAGAVRGKWPYRFRASSTRSARHAPRVRIPREAAAGSQPVS